MKGINKDYRDFDHDHYARSKDPSDFWGQIRRSVNGQPVSEKQISLLVASIISGLELTTDETLLDLACGNGALSARLFKYCRALHGVDLSEFLITTAKSNFEKFPNYNFSQEDLIAFLGNDINPQIYNKALCYGSFAYLSEKAANLALCLLAKRYKNLERVFIGNLPDYALRHRFFTQEVPPDSDLKEHTTSIGVWRSEDEFVQIATYAGWEVEIRRMDKAFYSARYRFDAVLKR